MMVMDLRNVMASKPGAATIQSVAGSLLRGSSDSTKNRWTSDADRTLRETLLLFFTYLFNELDSLILKRAAASASAASSLSASASASASAPFSPSSSSAIRSATQKSEEDRGKLSIGETFGQGDSRATFNLDAFVQRRVAMGDSKAVQDFLAEFVHSQMFERFCDERVKKVKRRADAWSASDARYGEDEIDEYDRVCIEIKSRQLPATVQNVKAAVQRVRRLYSSHSIGPLSADETTTISNMEFHDITMQLTHPNSRDSDINSYADRVCTDSCESDKFVKVMRSLGYRFNDVNSKQAGKALSLLHILLLSGPECVMSEALDFIPQIRLLLDPSNYKMQPMDYISITGSNQTTVDLRPKAMAVLSLLLDQEKLAKQRRWSDLWRHGAFSHLRYIPLKTELMTGHAFSDKQMPEFSSLHG